MSWRLLSVSVASSNWRPLNLACQCAHPHKQLSGVIKGPENIQCCNTILD
jgi:hypothetical protein